MSLRMRLAAMADVAAGDQPVDISSWVDPLREASTLLASTVLSDVAPTVLRDRDALRAGLARLDGREVGVVLGMVLSRVDELGDTPLPQLLRVLTGQVEALVADMGHDE